MCNLSLANFNNYTVLRPHGFPILLTEFDTLIILAYLIYFT